MPAISEKIPIAGIKLSNELFLVRLWNSSSSFDARSALCQTLAANRINMRFLTGSGLGDCSEATCCVPAQDGPQVKELILAREAFTRQPEFISCVGLLSLFPHRSSLKILGLSLSALGSAGLRVYAMASSLSALSFVTDYAHLLEAIRSLKECLNLPPGQISAPWPDNGSQ